MAAGVGTALSGCDALLPPPPPPPPPPPVTTRIVYGTTEQVAAALRASPVSYTINTYGVERNNLTVRQHARRMGRKVNAFSEDIATTWNTNSPWRLGTTIWWCHTAACDNAYPDAIPTKGPNGSPKQWKSVTPAMAAGLTDHIWTMDELLSFRVPPDALW